MGKSTLNHEIEATLSTVRTGHRLVCRVAAILAVASALALSACETTEGAGRDLEKLGDNIEDAASDAKD